MTITRRRLLSSTLAAGLCLSPALQSLLAANNKPRFRISACDWSLGRRQQFSAFELAKQIGLDGVQFSFDDVGAEYDLRKEDAREKVMAAAKQNNVAISSLAMGILNSIPYATDDRAEKWVQECVEVMHKMSQKVVLMAFFSNGDIKGKPELQAKVIARLKKVAPAAEKAGAILGIESWLSAEDNMRILDAVGSPAVRVYYDVANSESQGYDIYKEIRQLGRDRICEVHCKENASLLGKGRVDFRKVKDALDDINWSGWLVIEGATIPGRSLTDCYIDNQKYLRATFA
ncbi:MAG: sugar phosphate isomerase/epimerase family protein [Bacillota bacterium]